jgi:hypothetical protein
MPRYRYNKTSGAIIQQPSQIMNELIATTLKNRVSVTAEQLMLNMNMIMYADAPSPPPSWHERAMRRMSMYRNRITDAWLVLTGRADIGDWY